jgi:hypothetical protein
MLRQKLFPRLSRRALLDLAVGLVGGLIAASARAEPARFLVIVHPQNPAGSAARSFVADALLKKTTRWDDGEPIYPVDLRPDAPARRSFSDSVLRRSVAAVKTYWQQRIFSGRGVPPPELDADAAVVAYVAGRRGALGYVSEAAKLDKVKTLALH